MTHNNAGRGMRTFALIWIGQLVSWIGSGLTAFALGVWVYQRTGSVTQFALIALFTTLPGVVIAPLAGAVVDRWDRRKVLIVSDTVAALGTLASALLLLMGWLDIWQIYLIVAISSACGVFRWPAFNASTTLLVPKEQLVRANGMVQIAAAASQILPPVLAGVLLVAIGLEGIIVVDAVTFFFAIGTLLLLRIPLVAPSGAGASEQRSLVRDVTYGWSYLLARPGLLGLAILFAASNLFMGLIQVAVTPLVLSVASAAALGAVLTTGGLGMLAGSLTMSFWAGPKRRVYGVLGALLLDGIFILLGGLYPSVVLFAVAAFGFFFGLAFVNGYSWAIWQSKVAPDVQGRVFATIQMTALCSLPLGNLIAGPLSDSVFEPLLAVDGPLSTSFGAIIGVGPGRGIALLFILVGILLMVTAAAGYLFAPIRQVESLPDAVPSETPAQAESSPDDRAAYQPQLEGVVEP